MVPGDGRALLLCTGWETCQGDPVPAVQLRVCKAGPSFPPGGRERVVFPLLGAERHVRLELEGAGRQSAVGVFRGASPRESIPNGASLERTSPGWRQD